MSNLLLRKPEKREVIAISVPASTKKLWEELGKLANQQGFDLTGSISTALVGLIKQAKGELEKYAGTRSGTSQTMEQTTLSTA